MKDQALFQKVSVWLIAALLETGVAHASGKPVKVFLLAGQSNMVGHGKAEVGNL